MEVISNITVVINLLFFTLLSLYVLLVLVVKEIRKVGKDKREKYLQYALFVDAITKKEGDYFLEELQQRATKKDK